MAGHYGNISPCDGVVDFIPFAKLPSQINYCEGGKVVLETQKEEKRSGASSRGVQKDSAIQEKLKKENVVNGDTGSDATEAK